jgi:hypothetical protein
MKLYILLFLLVPLRVLSASDGGCADGLVNVLTSQLGATEHPLGSNWGRPVQDYLEAAGIDYPAPWCAAFIEWGLRKIGRKGAGAYCPNWDVPDRRTAPKCGSLGLVWFPSMKRYGHIFCVRRVISRDAVESIEGNSNADGSREGYAVVSRIRPASGRFVKW